MLRSSWRQGREPGADGPLLVSVTDFTSTGMFDLPGIAQAGYRLRRAWPELEGAVGMWLWAAPLSRRSGSVSAWTTERALHRFIGWAPHTAIMREYRGRGEIRATAWWVEKLDRTMIWCEAHDWLRHAGQPG